MLSVLLAGEFASVVVLNGFAWCSFLPKLACDWVSYVSSSNLSLYAGISGRQGAYSELPQVPKGA